MHIRKFRGDPVENMLRRFMLFADGDEGGDGDAGGGGEGDAGDKGEADAGKAAAGDGEVAGSDDWRAVIQDEKLRKHAVNFTSVEDMAGKHFSLRKELSTAITPLGKKPTDDQVTAYRKAIGAPETADGYEFVSPEGRDQTETDKAFQASAAEVFHGLKLTGDQAKGLNEWWNTMTEATQKAQTDADTAYAKESEDALKAEWPGEEFARNKAIADRAGAKLFGDSYDDVKRIEDKAGRFVLDNPAFVRMLAGVGREMEEGGLGGTMTDGDRNNVQDQIDALEKKIEQADASGDRATANRLYIAQQELYRQVWGSGAIVGDQGRAA